MKSFGIISFLHPARIKEIKQRPFEKIEFLSLRKFKLTA